MTLATTRLGRTGLTVSRLALGTMTFGLQTDEATSHRILDKAAEGGINFLDTADVYPLGGTVETTGRTEEIVGRWLQAQGPIGRARFIVATKAVNKVGPNPWDQGASRKHLLDAIDASLKRLQTDHVDLYQLHMDDRETPLDETLEALDVIVRSGRARYIGVLELHGLAAGPRARPIRRVAPGQVRLGAAALQPAVSRDRARAAAAGALEEGIGVIPYNPLAGGLLSGKYAPGSKPTGKRPLHARHGGLDVPGPLLERSLVRHRHAAAEARWRSRRAAGDARRRLGDGQPGDHGAARSAPAARSSSMRRWPRPNTSSTPA